jgi:N-acetylneuraminic acid mutarotase
LALGGGCSGRPLPLPGPGATATVVDLATGPLDLLAPPVDLARADIGLEPPLDFGLAPDLTALGDMAITCTTSNGACQLLALEPSLSNSGASLFFEGTFGADSTVSFPGGITRAATVLGPHRAQVTVPSGATAASLSINTGSSSVGPLPFRRASFALGLDPFATIYDQAGGALAMPTLSTPRQYATSVVSGNSVYVIGGNSLTNAPLASVERATINSDGTLTPFVPLPNVNLASPRWIHTSLVIGDNVYVFGGDSNTAQADVQRASLSNGTLSTFTTVPGVTLTVPRNCFSSVVIGNSVYVLGGWNDGNGPPNIATVERATINPDNTLTPFATVAGVTLAVPRSCPSTQVIGNSLYIIGGYSLSEGRNLDEIERATVNGDGTLSSFSIVPNVTLAMPRSGESTRVIGDGLYAIGGVQEPNEHALTSVERATINSDGSLSTFATVPGVALNTASDGPVAFVGGNSLYVAGGHNAGGVISRVERAGLDTSGNLSAFTATGDLTTARTFAATVTIGNSLYVIGGRLASTLATVERATINDDGTLGGFAPVPGVTLATPREDFPVVVSGRWLYAIGGRTGSSDITSVERAAINDDGSLSTFSIVPDVSLNVGHAAHSCTITGKWLYVIGGRNGLQYPGSERASINSDGSLATFSSVPDVALNTPRQFHTSVVSGGALYVLGGWNPGALASVERATIGTDGTLSSFSTVASASLIQPRFGHTSAVVGNALYVLGGLTVAGGGNLASLERATINSDGTLSPFTPAAATMGLARAGQGTLVVGNSLYVIGGQGEATTLTSIERVDLQ